jgi:hypothetical protein
VDVVVTHAEVNARHGTGVLLGRLFGEAGDVAFLRSRDDYDGVQRAGAFGLRLRPRRSTPGGSPRAAVREAVARALAGVPVRRVLCVPYHPEDVWAALALAERGAPLATWVMDDRNLEADGLPAGLLAELLQRSRLRLAISPELRDACMARYRVEMGVAPPVVDARFILRAPRLPPPGALHGRRGVMLGNVWGRAWLARLGPAVAGAGVAVDWYAAGAQRWNALAPEALAGAGIVRHTGLDDAALVAALRDAAFALLPSGTLDAEDDHRAIARYSLPSKAVFLAATAHVPLVVLGHPDTAAARFVTGQGLGFVVPYASEPLRAAVAALAHPDLQLRIRARAARLAPLFDASGVAEWLWASLRLGRPADDRFERALGGAGEARAGLG